MTFQDLQTQILKLPTQEKWQLLRILLDELEQNSNPPNPDQKTYPLHGLPITISPDFDEPI